MEAGIIGACFWIYILFLTLRAIAPAISNSPFLAPIYCYTLIEFTWSILFSPTISVGILPESFMIIVACDLLQMQTAANGRSRDTLPISPQPRFLHGQGNRMNEVGQLIRSGISVDAFR